MRFIDCLEPSQTDQLMAAWGRAYAEGRSPPRPQGASLPPSSTLREVGDAMAAWRRWHDVRADYLFSEVEWPWYATLERARVETVASRKLPGMARNLGQLMTLSPVEPLMARLYQVARQVFSDQATDETQLWGLELQANPAPPPSASLKHSLLKGIPWPWRSTSDQRGSPQTASGLDEAAALETLRLARGVLNDGAHFAEAVLPLVRALAGCHGVEAQDPLSQTSVKPVNEAMPNAEDITDEEHPEAQIERPGGQAEELGFAATYPDYRIFTRRWDEEHPASRWYCDADREVLYQLETPDRQHVRKLAHRLQRRLLAARLRQWSFEQEEGRLDSRRLAGLVGPRMNPRVFRTEEEAPVPEACVTLLVDQSGSMRGLRRRMAAMAIDLAVHTLESCQVRCEVLGYTTRYGGDNPLSQQWRQRERPERPGRLNALRHVVYKSANQPWRRARPYLGLLLREGFGQENIDGEALHWAAHRLMRQTQSRKVLIVLSDGAPYDEETVRANGRAFLEDHLRTVISEIEASAIELSAIGTGQAVGRFYRQALTVRQPEEVAEGLFDNLGDLLSQPAGQFNKGNWRIGRIGTGKKL
jgi:cobaltochelatase CobT